MSMLTASVPLVATSVEAAAGAAAGAVVMTALSTAVLLRWVDSVSLPPPQAAIAAAAARHMRKRRCWKGVRAGILILTGRSAPETGGPRAELVSGRAALFRMPRTPG